MSEFDIETYYLKRPYWRLYVGDEIRHEGFTERTKVIHRYSPHEHVLGEDLREMHLPSGESNAGVVRVGPLSGELLSTTGLILSDN